MIFSSLFNYYSIGFFRTRSDYMGYKTLSNLCIFSKFCLASSDSYIIFNSAISCWSFKTSVGSYSILSTTVWLPDLSITLEWPWDKDFCDFDKDIDIYEVSETLDLSICWIGVSFVTLFFWKTLGFAWSFCLIYTLSIQIIYSN